MLGFNWKGEIIIFIFENILTILILTGLEIILGVDNLFVLLLFSNQLPEHQRRFARILGLSLAFIIRIGLLAFAFKLATFQQALFHISSHPISIRDLLFFLGGVFLLISTTNELIKYKTAHNPNIIQKKISFSVTVAQIVFFDFLFSFDSVITAIGVTIHYWLVVVAVMLSMCIVLAASRPLANFLQKYPRVTLVALYFLVLVGVMLIIQAINIHVATYYVLVALGAAILLELLRAGTVKLFKKESTMHILTIDCQSSNAASEFARSLKDTGFAVLKNHPIKKELFTKVEEEWKRFFARDQEFKRQYWYANNEGYFPTENAKGYSINDLKEFYHVFDWGRIPEGIGQDTLQLRTEMFSLAKQLLHWLNQEAPAEVKAKFSIPLVDMINEKNIPLRILHYPPLQGDEAEGAIRAAAHEDIDLITVLPVSTQPGLEVQGSNGEWVKVEGDPGTLIINAGDILQEASGHYYKSTKHQVVNPSGENARKPRYSMPMFVNAKLDARLSARYPTAKDYMNERFKEQGLKEIKK
jgi:predicted tellurium resistance membrane protein TerC/isopenicillin N synthase-like dioxygenase